MNDIYDLAHDRWDTIATELTPALSEAIGKNGKHVPCLIHGGKDGFRLFRDFNKTGGAICNTCGPFSNGVSLIMAINGWTFKQTASAIRGCLGGDLTNLPRRAAPIKTDKKVNDFAKNNIDEVLSKSTATGDPVNKYLVKRGLGKIINSLPSDILFIENLACYEDKKLTGQYPAMVCPIRNLSGEVVSIHRTYLTDQGDKAPITSPKKIMQPAEQGATSGCSIQLFEATETLAVTEGVETALAVYQDTGVPCWAAITAGGLERVEIPSAVKRLLIVGDKDLTGVGERSANVLAQRMLKERNNLTVRVLLPKEDIPESKKSVDWLDVYVSKEAK